MTESANHTLPAPTLPPPTAAVQPEPPTAFDVPAPVPGLPDAMPMIPEPVVAAPTTVPPARDTLTLPNPGAQLPVVETELPRLSDTITAAPPAPRTAPLEPTVSPLPTGEMPDLPSLPDAAPVAPASVAPMQTPDSDDDGVTAEPDHPMAHLMQTKAAVTEAGKRAAEYRAEQKRRSRRFKIYFFAGFAAAATAFVVFVGPWLMNAINEAGGIQNDEPAVEQPVGETPADETP